MSFEYRRRPPDSAPLGIQVVIRFEDRDLPDQGEVPSDRKGGDPRIEAWQAEQALYHAVRFHEGIE